MPEWACFVCGVSGAERVIYRDTEGRGTLLSLCRRCQELAGKRVVAHAVGGLVAVPDDPPTDGPQVLHA